MTQVLSLCICVRNGERTLGRLLSQILPQAERFNLTVHVVDHLSTDQTAALLREFAHRHPSALILSSFSEHGIARVREYAWRHTTSEWIGFLDADCEPSDTWCQEALAAIHEHHRQSRVAAIGGKNLAPQSTAFYRTCSLMLSSWIGGHSSTLNRAQSTTDTVCHLPTLNVLYRRSALEKVGGFDPRFTRVAEDLDLSFRLRADAHELVYLPRMTITHQFRGTTLDWLRNMHLYGMGRTLMIQAHPESFELKFALPPLVLTGVLVSGFVLLIPYLLLVTALLAPKAYAERSSFGRWLGAAALTASTHFAYAWGMLEQLFRNPLHFKSEG